MRVCRHVDRRAGHRHREVAAVIQIEAAQEVLIGFSLATVLRDDHAGHCLEHLALPHEWPHIELLRGDRALTRRCRDADQVFRGVLGVGEIDERALADDHDFRVQGQMQHLVGGDGLPGLDL
jgi:hypothetical protein